MIILTYIGIGAAIVTIWVIAGILACVTRNWHMSDETQLFLEAIGILMLGAAILFARTSLIVLTTICLWSSAIILFIDLLFALNNEEVK